MTSVDGLTVKTGISEEEGFHVLVQLSGDDHTQEFALTLPQTLALIKALTTQMVDYYQEEETDVTT